MSDGLITRTDLKAVVKNVTLVLGQSVAPVIVVLYLSLPWSALGVCALGVIFGLALMFAPPIHEESVDENRLYDKFNRGLYEETRRFR